MLPVVYVTKYSSPLLKTHGSAPSFNIGFLKVADSIVVSTMEESSVSSLRLPLSLDDTQELMVEHRSKMTKPTILVMFLTTTILDFVPN
ncbi:MAG: hypothetical protein OR998_03200 [Flavobacteriaceae bacterium]|nr:hypothetical protein [Flavobacteriaceae bacterium]